MTATIPESLCDHMFSCLGGKLNASPANNPCGHSRDAYFTIVPEAPVSGATITEKLIGYYRGVGANVEICTSFCFEVTLRDGTKLWVSVSNYSDDGRGKIIFSVEVMR
ncbi:MAG: hypothetical protein WC250_01930 [Candidatus Paceibacterota bacterium]|jgi:hypothetical protein